MIFCNLRPAVVVLLAMLVMTGIIYPLLVTLIGQIAFNFAANGSLIVDQGKIKGSTLIGQPFTDPKYFWGRPTATTPFPYNASASTGSNFGELNPTYLKQVQERVAIFKKDNPQAPIPIDLVTSSGSGLDPHISILGAEYQIERIAKTRSLSVETVKKMVQDASEPPALGFLGEPRVNVLLLNQALDRLPKGR